MQDKEPNYYRNKKRWDRIVSFLKTGAVILVFGGAAVYLALFLVNLIFRSGPPKSSTEQQVQRMEQLEQQSDGGGGDSGLLAGFTGEPETKSFDKSIPLTTATPDVAVTPLDEQGNPVGGSGGGTGAGDSGPSPQLSGESGQTDGSAQQDSGGDGGQEDTQQSGQADRQDDNQPEPTPAQREAQRFAEQQAERAAQDDSGNQDGSGQNTDNDAGGGQDQQQDSGGDGRQQSETDQDQSQSGQDGAQQESGEDLLRYQLLTPPLSSRSRAEQQLGTAREIGFTGFIESANIQGEERFRVKINERFSTYDAAKSARQRLQEAGIQVVLFKRGG